MMAFFSPCGEVAGVRYVRGDANSDSQIDVSDAVYMLANLFPYPAFDCLRTVDVNLDSTVNVADVTYFLSHLFPSPNFPPPNICGINFADTLPCDCFPPCGYTHCPPNLMMENTEEEGRVNVRIGNISKMSEAVWIVPIFIQTDVNIAGFELKLKVDGKVKAVKNEGCITESYDYFDAYIDNSNVFVASLVSLRPGEGGKVRQYMEPGYYHIADLLVLSQSLPDVKVEKAVFSDIHGYSIKNVRVPLSNRASNKKPKDSKIMEIMPNPFTGTTTISYSLSKEAKAQIGIYNSTGRKVKKLVDKVQRAGYYNITWDGIDERGNQVPHGIYFCKFKAGEYQSVRKIVYLK